MVESVWAMRGSLGRLGLFGGGDFLLEFGLPGAVASSSAHARMASEARSVASSASRRASSGGVLPPWAASTATPCWASASSRSSAVRAPSADSHASWAAFSASATARADAAAGAGAGCSGLPHTAHGMPGCNWAASSAEALASRSSRRSSQRWRRSWYSSRARLWRSATAARPSPQGVTPDQDHQFLGSGGLLLANLDFCREFLQRTQCGEQCLRFGPQAVQGRSPGCGPLPVAPAQAKLGDCGSETAEPALIRQPFRQHRPQ